MVKTVPTTGSVRFKPQVNEAAPGAIFAKADLVVLHVDCSNGSFWPNPLSSDHHPELNLLAKSELGRAPYMVFSSPQSFFGHGRMEVHLADPFDPVVAAPDLGDLGGAGNHTIVDQPEPRAVRVQLEPLSFRIDLGYFTHRRFVLSPNTQMQLDDHADIELAHVAHMTISPVRLLSGPVCFSAHAFLLSKDLWSLTLYYFSRRVNLVTVLIDFVENDCGCCCDVKRFNLVRHLNPNVTICLFENRRVHTM